MLSFIKSITLCTIVLIATVYVNKKYAFFFWICMVVWIKTQVNVFFTFVYSQQL